MKQRSVKSLFILVMATGGSAADRCLPLTDDAVHALATYIKEKYEIAPATRLELGGVDQVPGTCYQRLQFRLQPEVRAAGSMIFFLSPDQQFLMRDLMDTKIDPQELKQKEERARGVDLARVIAPRRGPKDAPVTITIFSDFQCPYCRRAAEMLNEDVLPRASTPVQLVYRYLPLSIHPWARPAAEIAACVDQQSDGAFWRVHDFLFTHQTELTIDNLRKRVEDGVIGQSPEVDMKAYAGCVEERRASQRIDEDLRFAADHDINVTPTMFVNGVRRNGLISLDEMRRLIWEQGLAQDNSLQK